MATIEPEKEEVERSKEGSRRQDSTIMKVERDDGSGARPVEMTKAGGDDGEPVYHEFSAEKHNLVVKAGETGKPPVSKPRKITAHFGNEQATKPTAANSKTLEPTSAESTNMRLKVKESKEAIQQVPDHTNSLQLHTTKDDNRTNTLSAGTSERNDSQGGEADDMFERVDQKGQQSKFRANLNEQMKLRNGGDGYTTQGRDDDKKKGATKYQLDSDEEAKYLGYQPVHPEYLDWAEIKLTDNFAVKQYKNSVYVGQLDL